MLMKGSIFKDNCYMWISQPPSKVESMKEIVSEDDVQGLQKLKIEEELPLMVFMRLMQGVFIEGKDDDHAGGLPNIE